MQFDRDTWKSASSGDRLRIAEIIPSCVTPAFRFLRLEQFEMGGEANEIAIFELEDAEFSFIPGCTAEIGFDVDSWTPTPEEDASWSQSAAECADSWSINELLRRMTHPPERINVSSMLVERDRYQPPWQFVDERDAALEEVLNEIGIGKSVWSRRLGPRSQTTFFKCETKLAYLQVWLNTDGSVTARSQPRMSCAEAKVSFADAGLRLLTGIEWEYLCSGGVRSLFRWGDHVPCHFGPAEPPDPRGANSEGWVEHRRPNAFGLLMPSDTYDCEVVSDGGCRGGDGGSMGCGGVGAFAEWLTLSPWYFLPQLRESDTTRRGPMRRAVDLTESSTC